MKRIAIIVVFLIGGLGIGAFVFRGSLRDAWFELRRPSVPPAVSVDELPPANTNSAPPTPTNANRPVVRPPANTNTPTNKPVPVNTNTNQPTEPNTTVPVSFNMAIPFTSQAPLANWEGSYEDGCEEASALMVHYFYTKRTFTTDIAMQELDDAFAWEDAHIGTNFDTTAAETLRMIREYYGYTKAYLDTDVSVEHIKELIAQGLPIIIPAYGKALGNPNFRNGGPDYHMLVIKGYNATHFVTNDPGTRRGADYVYSHQTILNAIHDWNGGDVEHGQQVMIVVPR